LTSACVVKQWLLVIIVLLFGPATSQPVQRKLEPPLWKDSRATGRTLTPVWHATFSRPSVPQITFSKGNPSSSSGTSPRAMRSISTP
jgi:hypothetical protein